MTTIAARIGEARAAIVAACEAKGMVVVVGNLNDLTVEGVPVRFSAQGYDPVIRQGWNGKVTCSVIGERWVIETKNYPEGKSGLNIPKIVARIAEVAAAQARAHDSQDRATAERDAGNQAIANASEQTGVDGSQVLVPAVENKLEIALEIEYFQAESFLRWCLAEGIVRERE